MRETVSFLYFPTLPEGILVWFRKDPVHFMNSSCGFLIFSGRIRCRSDCFPVGGNVWNTPFPIRWLPDRNTASLIRIFSGGFRSFSRMETAGLLRKVHGFQPVPDRIRRPESSTWAVPNKNNKPKSVPNKNTLCKIHRN
jgi:hypothetical protein